MYKRDKVLSIQKNYKKYSYNRFNPFYKRLNGLYNTYVKTCSYGQ